MDDETSKSAAAFKRRRRTWHRTSPAGHENSSMAIYGQQQSQKDWFEFMKPQIREKAFKRSIMLNSSMAADVVSNKYWRQFSSQQQPHEGSSRARPFVWQRRRRRRAAELVLAYEQKTQRNKCVQQENNSAALVLFLFIIMTICSIALMANGQNEQESLPAPEALVYALEPFSHELGSGDYSRRPPLAPVSQAPDDTSAPPLIEAKCWNNLADDNDCNHLNVITGPMRPDNNANTNADVSVPATDSLITPVVIFESASSVPETEQQQQQPRLPHLAPPYYQPVEQKSTVRPASGTSSPTSTTGLDEQQQLQPTRPSVVHFVATTRRPTSTSTAGRRCRDDNDADCDEPEGSSLDADADEERDQDEQNNTRRPDLSRLRPKQKPSSSSEQIESGSGAGQSGAPNDDNDDSTDDDPDEEDGPTDKNDGTENSVNDDDDDNDDGVDGDVDGQTSESSGDSSVGNAISGQGLVEIASASATTAASPTTTFQPTASIDLVVHSSLPSDFPSSSTDATAPKGNERPDSTPMPEETWTSRPIFPSTSAEPAPAPDSGATDNSSPPDDADPGATTDTKTTATTSDDLDTFKPVPLPSEAPPWRFSGQQQMPTGSSTTPASSSATEMAGPVSARPRPVGPIWTTHWPAPTVDAGEQQTQESADTRAIEALNARQRQATSRNGSTVSTEMLPTLLLYASVIILATTTLIFVLMALIFWRRNNERRRLLLHKLQQANAGFGPSMAGGIAGVPHISGAPHGGHMNQPPGAGLMGTYAVLGKGSDGFNGLGKVTTNLVRDEQRQLHPSEPDDEQRTPDDEEEDDEVRLVDPNATNSRARLDKTDDGCSLSIDTERSRAREIGPNKKVPAIERHAQQSAAQAWGSVEEHSSVASVSNSSACSSGTTQLNGTQMNATQPATVIEDGATGRNQHYPNSLSDGRQNSSSISDSQCSPDSVHHQAIGPPPTSIPMRTNVHSSQQHHHHNHQAPPPMHTAYGGSAPFHPVQGTYTGMGLPLAQQQQKHVIIMQNGANTPPMQFKHRFMAPSRSIEALDRGPNYGLASQHVGFSEHGQQHAPFINTNGHLPASTYQQQQLGRAQQRVQLAGNQFNQRPSMAYAVSPQRVAMDPLATLARRVPLGTSLNRNVYSEDSSSFMTASPSLARTLSSSSFAFNSMASTVNLAPGASQTPLMPPIKPKPILDASGRVINDYTGACNGANNGHQQQPTGAPPVFGRQDRSEAWFL